MANNIHEGWWKVPAQVRITKAIFNFENRCWEVSGYIDFTLVGNDSLLSKEFTHSWTLFDDEAELLEKLLIKRCGNDLVGPEKTMEALRKRHK